MLYLIEDVPHDFKPNEGDTLIALTPMACYHLDKKGAPYKIPEDFYDDLILIKDEDEYFFDQLEWFEKFNDLVDEVIPFRRESKISFVWLYYYFLKMMVDMPLLHLSLLKKVVHSGKEKIVYISKDRPDQLTGTPTTKTLYYPNESIYKELLPLFCDKNNISLETISFQHASKPPSIKNLFKAGLRSLINRNRKISAFVRTARIFVGISKIKQIAGLLFSPRSANNSGRKTFLFLRLAWGFDQQAREALQRGHRVIIKVGAELYEYTGVTLHCIDTLPNIDGTESAPYWDDACKRQELETEILSWINQRAGYNISRIISKKLEIFFKFICPALLTYHSFFKRFIVDQKIDYVIAPYISSHEDFGAMSAAKTSITAKAVLSQHGATVFDNYFSDMVRLVVPDIFTPFFNEVKDYHENKKRMFPFPMAEQILVSSYFSDICKIGNTTRKMKKKKGKETVVYVPTFFKLYGRRFNSAEYPPTWYYRHQLQLLEYMSTKTEFTFIWKTLSSQDGDINPLPSIIREKGYSNIHLSDKKFIEHLSTSDRVITDWGSSAFYESAIAGIPTLCVSHRSLKIRPRIKEIFGKSFKQFTKFEEFKGHIEDFLQEDPKEYVRHYPQPDADFINELELLPSENR